MNCDTLIENNPFFNHGMDKLCIICNSKLKNVRTSHSIFDELSESQSQMKVFEALELLSNFKEFDFQDGPQNICELCYNNTSSAFRFREMCNTSVSFIKSYVHHQKESKKPIMPESTTTSEVLGIQPEILKIEDETDMKMKIFPESAIIKTETIEDEAEILDKDDEERTDNGILKLKCKVCNTFFRKDYMPIHKRIHTGEKPFSCEICGKRFNDPATKRLHKAIHIDQRDFLCTVCGKTFKRKPNLRNHHIRQHTDERPYECDICGNKFRENKTLQEHYVVHSDERPFACEVCGKCFPGKKHLRQHMISHAEVKRHECHLCGKRFTQAHTMRTHLSKYCKGSS